MNFISHKNQQWQKLYYPTDIVLDPISITYEDQKYDDVAINMYSSLDIAKEHKVKNVIAAKINGKVIDAWRAVGRSGKLELLTFNDDKGKHEF